MNINQLVSSEGFAESYLDKTKFPKGYGYEDIDEIIIVEDDSLKDTHIEGVIEISFIGNFRKRSDLQKHDEETTIWADYIFQEQNGERNFSVYDYDLKVYRKRFTDKQLLIRSVKEVRSPKTLIKGEIEIISIPPKEVYHSDLDLWEPKEEDGDGLRFVAALIHFKDYYAVGVRWHSLTSLGIPQSTARKTWMILPQEEGLRLIEYYGKQPWGYMEKPTQYFIDKLNSNMPKWKQKGNTNAV